MSNPLLVVDDDPAFLQLASEVLGRSGRRVAVAQDATQALQLFAFETFDLVLSKVADLSRDFAFVAALREHRPAQEILVISEWAAEPEVVARALQSGASECLPRPMEPEALFLAVTRALERVQLRQDNARLHAESSAFARHRFIHQRGMELLSQPDLEWLQERILADLSELTAAQSAALWSTEERGDLMLRAYRGLVDRQQLPARIQSDVAGPMQGLAPWTSGEGRTRMLHVPLHSAGELVGLVQLADPLSSEFRSESLEMAAMFADFAGSALRNGRRLAALQRVGLRDRETAAYNLSYFTDYASKEIYKARRYGRTFSLLTFSIDSLASMRHRLGAEEARRAPRAVIRAVSRIIRDSDVLAKASDAEFYLLLPETDFFGAVMFLRRAFDAVREEPDVQELETRLPLALVAGASTYPRDGEDFDELVHRCRKRMDERRASLQRRLVLDPLDFWEKVELLVGSPQSPRLPQDERAEPSRRGKVSPALFEELQAEVARELLRDPTARGVVYVGGPEVRAGSALSVALEAAPPDLAARVYVLGRRADLQSHPALTPVFVEGDERLARHQFLLWLSENSAYALLQRAGHGQNWGFHSSDAAVVDGLVSRLQSAYDLQPY